MEFYLAVDNIDTTVLITPTHTKEKRIHKIIDGTEVKSVRFLIFDSKLDFLNLENQENFSELLKNENFEFNIETAGQQILHSNHLVVDDEFNPVYNYKDMDILERPNQEPEKRNHKDSIRNTLESVPVFTSDEYFTPKELLQKYIISKSYFLVHKDGASYKFLYDFAKKLSDLQKIVRVYAYNQETKKKAPLVLKKAGKMYPGAFIMGKIEGEEYCLTLLLSNMEILPK